MVLSALLTAGLALLVAAFRTSPPAPAPAFEPAALPAVRPATLAPPALPRAGGVSAAIWARSDAPPVAPVELVQTAGVPAVVVRTADEAFTHPLVLVWPDVALSGGELDAARAYADRGGAAAGRGAGRGDPARWPRRQAACSSGSTCRRRRPRTIGRRPSAQLRSLWSKVRGGFLLADVPGGKVSGLVAVHDVRAPLRRWPRRRSRWTSGLAASEATYAVQGSVLSAADGPLAAAQAQAALGEVRERGGELVAGGLTGAPLDAPCRAGLLGSCAAAWRWSAGSPALAPTSVRAVEAAPAIEVAAGEQAAGVTLDASLDTPDGGPGPAVPGSHRRGVRPVLRVPTTTDAATAGTAVVAGPTAPLEPRLRAQDDVLGRAGQEAWRGARRLRAVLAWYRLSLAIDVRPARAGEPWVGGGSCGSRRREPSRPGAGGAVRRGLRGHGHGPRAARRRRQADDRPPGRSAPCSCRSPSRVEGAMPLRRPRRGARVGQPAGAGLDVGRDLAEHVLQLGRGRGG